MSSRTLRSSWTMCRKNSSVSRIIASRSWTFQVGRLAAVAHRLEQAQEPIELGLGGGAAKGAGDELAQALAHAVAVARAASDEAIAELGRLECLVDDLLRRVEVLLQEDGRERQ